MVSNRCLPDTLCGISSRFQLLSPSERQVAHALLTRSPLSHIRFLTEISKLQASFDLHVLGTPPAFVLSQDQTLKYGILTASQRQIKPIRAVCHSLFKRIVRKPFGSLKEPFSGAFRISFYLHCLIYKVHSQPRKALKINLFGQPRSCLSGFFRSGLSVRCLTNIALGVRNVKSFFNFFRDFLSGLFKPLTVRLLLSCVGEMLSLPVRRSSALPARQYNNRWDGICQA